MKKILFLAASIFLVSACSRDIDVTPKKIYENEDNNEIVLQERDPNLSRVWSKRQKEAVESRSGFYLEPEQFLGYSYRIGNTIVGDFVNTGYSVIDIDRLKTRYPTYVLHTRILDTDRGQYTYATYDRYLEHSSVTNKKTKGWELNLGLFKIGRKKETTEKFTNYYADSTETAYGEFWYEARYGRHTMQKNSTATRNIACDYLHTDFLDVLYNSPKTELLEDYGPFIITDYYTGGRVTAMYYSRKDGSTTVAAREYDMKRNVDASFTWETDSIGKVNFYFGRNNASGEAWQDLFMEDKFYVKTSGGSISIGTPALDINNTNIDLTPWLNTLEDIENHTLVGFVDEGMSGISEFILEENFKEIIEDTHLDYRYNDYHIEPYIEIMKVLVRSSGGVKLYDVAAVLSTRENDKLILSDGTAISQSDEDLMQNSDPEIFLEKAQAIANEMGQYFQCLIKTSPTKTINPIFRNPLNFELSGIDLSRMKKFNNPNTDMWYIYDPTARVAFAYYMDDYILEAYGLKEWAETIPEVELSMSNLAQRYRIFGL